MSRALLNIRETFRWKTMTGDVLRLDQMETSHIFNSMKMCFNHLASVAGGKPVWFVKQYREYCEAAEDDPKQLAWLVLFFIQELEYRNDLPAKFREPYGAILEQIRPRLIEEERLKLPAPAAGYDWSHVIV